MRRTPVEALITYASFFALSLIVHMLVILGGRQLPGEAGPEGGPSAAAERAGPGPEAEGGAGR